MFNLKTKRYSRELRFEKLNLRAIDRNDSLKKQLIYACGRVALLLVVLTFISLLIILQLISSSSFVSYAYICTEALWIVNTFFSDRIQNNQIIFTFDEVHILWPLELYILMLQATHAKYVKRIVKRFFVLSFTPPQFVHVESI